MSLAKALGQLIIATYPGQTPPSQFLEMIQAGHIGAVILMGDNTAGGPGSVLAATRALQAAARRGGNPGLLIMTDQEGGLVKRIVGGPSAPPTPPTESAAEMGRSGDAHHQGVETGRLLRSVGVNVDLAPVADVTRVDGFIAQEQRSFGSDPRRVASLVCGFARGLSSTGVAYTLKHFPGLGDAVANTDNAPVSITEPEFEISADDAAYRMCAHGPRALVMVSSASYANLTGSTPAVLSPLIYHKVIPADGIRAVTISDSFESGSISGLSSPARTAINAGLDMVMYPDYAATAAASYVRLLHDAETATLGRRRVMSAALAVIQLKRNLGLL